MPTHGIRDLAPAGRWEDAFLSGNGEFGIMVFGDPAAERIVLNHHRFVLPNGTRDLRAPRLADRMGRVRELTFAGRRAEASALLAGGEPLRWTQPFHPGFVLTVTGDPGPVADYRRTTDFTSGEISVGWSGTVRRRAFVSRADTVVVQHVNQPGAVVALSGDLPGRPPEVDYELRAYGKRGLTFIRARGTYPPGLGAHGYDHRHISHLYPVWPLHEITPEETPELAAAARRALLLRGDENLSAHGSLHRALVAARLHDPEPAYDNLRKIIGNDMVFRSFLSSHNPGLETYNADAAHALPGVLLEMLLDSRPGLIRLLPALPAVLPRGVLRGAACRCRVVVRSCGGSREPCPWRCGPGSRSGCWCGRRTAIVRLTFRPARRSPKSFRNGEVSNSCSG